MHARLGLHVHRDAWPTTALLAAYADAGFAWVQVHAAPRAMLAERRHGLRHARAVRAALDGTGLRLLLHAPDDLSAGTSEHDRAFAGLLDHAAAAGAELVAYHGLNFAEADGPAAERLRERAQLEERSLTPLLQRAHSLGITVAIENLAPRISGRPAPIARPARGARPRSPPRRARGRDAARPRPSPHHRRRDPLRPGGHPRRVRAPRRPLPRARQPRLPASRRRAGRRPDPSRPSSPARPRLAPVVPTASAA